MKNFILFAAIMISINAFAATEPTLNPKVLKTFNEVFKDARNVQWNSSTSFNQASFESGDIQTRATIDNNGRLVRTIRYYKEENLPSNILYNVKKQYNEEAIWGVTEISGANGISYQIVLQCKSYWYHITSDDRGNLNLTSKIKRADL